MKNLLPIDIQKDFIKTLEPEIVTYSIMIKYFQAQRFANQTKGT
jgi:hypothetical protein